MATLGKPMDPESYKRERSGFWKRHVDLAQDIETWTCDKRKLNDAISRAMLDPIFAREFHTQGSRILDKLWGEGTAEAFSYRTKGDQDRVNMRFDMGATRRRYNDDGADAMAYLLGTNSTSTTTTGTSINTWTTASTNAYIRDEIEARVMRDRVNNTPPPQFKPKKKALVRNMPFACAQGTLLATLQRDFDYWAKDQMELISG